MSREEHIFIDRDPGGYFVDCPVQETEFFECRLVKHLMCPDVGHLPDGTQTFRVPLECPLRQGPVTLVGVK